jgi:hypothetical protein
MNTCAALKPPVSRWPCTDIIRSRSVFSNPFRGGASWWPQDLSAICFAGCGLAAGRHYVAVKRDLSDLVERIRHYLDRPDEAQAIADAGFARFRRHFMFSGVNMPPTLYRLAVRLILPLIHSL